MLVVQRAGAQRMVIGDGSLGVGLFPPGGHSKPSLESLLVEVFIKNTERGNQRKANAEQDKHLSLKMLRVYRRA